MGTRETGVRQPCSPRHEGAEDCFIHRPKLHAAGLYQGKSGKSREM